MKLICSVVALAALTAGCAGTGRPTTGPGSGYGANYVPSVEPHSDPAPVYDAAVQKCQKWARDIPYVYSGQHTEALNILGFASGAAFGANTPLRGIDLVAGAGALTGGAMGFAYWVETPERQAWYARQETMMMNCMTREGYANDDPTVTVTWKKIDPHQATPRVIGVDTYNAERVAKNHSCGALPAATLVAKGPGYETYSVPCQTAGAPLQVRCEFGNCRTVR